MATKKAAAKPTPDVDAPPVLDDEAAASAVSKPPVEVDRVASVSLRADGTPDQTDGYEVIGE